LTNMYKIWYNLDSKGGRNARRKAKR
jgi:hypothetical protein